MEATEKFLSKLKNDNVYTKTSMVAMEELTGHPTRKGLSHAILSEGKIVNVVSNSYGHLPNQQFFGEVERSLISSDIQYATRSINRDNGSFVVDYILTDPNYVVKIKNGMDKILPMTRFTNSYDGSCKTSGHLGFFRQVCSNGLHVAQSNIAFSVKHRGSIVELVMPKIEEVMRKFMDNEYYSLSKKFEVLAERTISANDLQGFVKLTADKLNIFKFESSEKNPAPSLNARTILETISRESTQMGEQPNAWLVYNAFNELLHDKMKKTFEQQKNLDGKLFEIVSAMV